MTQPSGGLSGLAGWVWNDPEATPEERLGGTVDPAHARDKSRNDGRQSWEVMPGQKAGPHGHEGKLIGASPEGMIDKAGHLGQDPTADLQPVTHAAPWPKGVPTTADPEETAEWRRQNAHIHGMSMGAGRDALYAPTLEPRQDSWELIHGEQLGSTLQDDVAGQLRTVGSGGAGSTDRKSTDARQNRFGFDRAHQQRRFADVGTGAFPGNFLWMQPGSRPLVKSFGGTARPAIGQDSPFEGQDITRDFGSHGAALATPPAAYIPPPDPITAPGYPVGDPAPVSWY